MDNNRNLRPRKNTTVKDSAQSKGITSKPTTTINRNSLTTKSIFNQNPPASRPFLTTESSRTSLGKRLSIPPRKSDVSAASQLINPTQTTKSQSLLDKVGCIESRIKKLEEESTQQSLFNSVETAIGILKAENSELKLTIDQLKTDLQSVQYVLADLSSLETEYRTTEATCTRLTTENQELKTEISSLKTEVINIKNHSLQYKGFIKSSDRGISAEQQEINSNIVIRGVNLANPSNESEPTTVFEAIRTHLDIATDDVFDPISIALLPSSKSKPSTATKTIQVRFRSTATKKQFLQVRRIKKNISPADLNLVQTSKKAILITEQLTRSNQELLYAARSLRNTHKYKFVWSNDGQILVRKQQGSKVIRITEISQVNDLRSSINLEPLTFPNNGRLSTNTDIESPKSDS